MNPIKKYILIALNALQGSLTAYYFIFTLLFSYIELVDTNWVTGGTFLIASSLFWWSGSGLRGALLGGQFKSGLLLTTIFCGIAYWLIGTLPSKSATAVFSIQPLNWGIIGFILAGLATSKRHIEVVKPATSAAPMPLKTITSEDDLERAKEQLFYEWAAEHLGEEEGKMLYGACLHVRR
jgi:hypothetical protein